MKLYRLAPAVAVLLACNPGDNNTVTPATTFDMVAAQQQPFATKLVDAFGMALQGNVSWTSTNPAAATVDQNGVVTAVHTGVTTVTGISDHSSAAVLITVHQGGMVNPDSGATYSDDRTFWITRPAGVFELGALTLTPLPTPPLPNAVAGTAWMVGSGIFQSSGRVLASFKYDPAALPQGANPRHLQFRGLDGGAIGGNSVDTVAHTVSIPLDVGKLVLVVEPFEVDSIRLSFEYTLRVGNHEPLTLHAFGSDPTGVAVHWQSADPSTISVSSSGEVTALRAGTVQISAEMDGVVGTLLVTAQP